MSTHLGIVKAVRAAHAREPKPAASLIDQMTDEEVLRLMFTNLRVAGGGYRGLQLGQGGLAIMRSFFRCHEIVLPEQQTFSSRHVLFLDRTCSMPWSAQSWLPVTIWLFEPDLAMRIKLVGDLDAVITAFSS